VVGIAANIAKLPELLRKSPSPTYARQQGGYTRTANSMTSPSSWYGLAHNCRMRAEARAQADELKEAEPKAIMLRIAADYEKLAEWAEKNSVPWWDKKRAS